MQILGAHPPVSGSATKEAEVRILLAWMRVTWIGPSFLLHWPNWCVGPLSVGCASKIPVF